MKHVKLEFDEVTMHFRKAERKFRKTFLKILGLFIVSLSLAVFYYFILSLFVSTDTERRIRKENRMYEKIYPQMEQRAELLEAEIGNLRSRDNEIYRDIFHSPAPDLTSMTGLPSLSDSIPDKNIYDFINTKVELAVSEADRVEENFRFILEAVFKDGFKMPPMTMPLKDYTIERTGASVGMKMSPFYKVPSSHQGIDLLASTGSDVISPAPGTVMNIIHSRKGRGNVVEINHGNGYRTSYSHLSEISVRVGQTLKTGDRIGSVGISGNSFVPHLHYEVIRDSLIFDPLNFFFGSVTPDEYSDMITISSSTGQSMD